MPTIVSNLPILVEHAKEGPPLVLRINSYGWKGFFETQIIQCADESLVHKRGQTLREVANRACSALYGETFPLDTFKVYVKAANSSEQCLLVDLARASDDPSASDLGLDHSHGRRRIV